MKKLLNKYLTGLVVFIVIALTVCKVVDMHTDGIKIRDGYYYICQSTYTTRIFDIPYAVQDVGTKVQMRDMSDGANQRFYIQYVEDEKYCIRYWNNDMCLGVGSSGAVELQQYSEQETQLWKMERTENTQYFTISSCATGLYMKMSWSDEYKALLVSLEQLDSEDQNYYFRMY